MRDYELVLIISPEVAEEEVPNTLEKVNEVITSRGGAVVDTNHWGRRKLAYPIKRFTEGNYVLTRFQLEPELVREVEETLKVSEEVLRHLIVKIDE